MAAMLAGLMAWARAGEGGLADAVERSLDALERGDD
jgi:hypothetical protein